MAAHNLEKIELLWKFALQRESAILMYLLLVLAHTKRFAVRENNNVGGMTIEMGLAKFLTCSLEFRQIEKVRS